MKTALLLALLTSAAAVAGEKHDDFNSILRRVESHYGKRHLKIPLMGLLSFTSNIARPVGVSDFKLAVIEGVSDRADSLPDFHPGADWQPFIKTTSRNGDRTILFGRDEGHAVRALMLVIDRDEAVLIEMRLNPTRFAKFLAEKSEHH